NSEHSEPAGKISRHLRSIFVPFARQVPGGCDITEPNARRCFHLHDGSSNFGFIQFVACELRRPTFDHGRRRLRAPLRVALLLIGHEFRWKSVVMNVDAKWFTRFFAYLLHRTALQKQPRYEHSPREVSNRAAKQDGFSVALLQYGTNADALTR